MEEPRKVKKKTKEKEEEKYPEENKMNSRALCHVPVISSLGRLRQMDQEFKLAWAT